MWWHLLGGARFYRPDNVYAPCSLGPATVSLRLLILGEDGASYSSARIERRTSFRCWAAITVPRTTGARLSACRSVFIWMAATVPPAAGAWPVLGPLRFVPGCAVFIAWRSSAKWTALIGVPAGNRSPDVASVQH